MVRRSPSPKSTTLVQPLIEDETHDTDTRLQPLVTHTSAKASLQSFQLTAVSQADPANSVLGATPSDVALIDPEDWAQANKNSEDWVWAQLNGKQGYLPRVLLKKL